MLSLLRLIVETHKTITRDDQKRAILAAATTTILAIIVAALFTAIVVLVARERNWPAALLLSSSLCLLLVPLPCYFFYSRLFCQQRLNRQLTQVAREDHLTGVFNRPHLMSMLERELALSQRHNYPVSVLLMEISDFSTIQDGHGRAVGERVLRSFADKIKEKIRESDLFGRFDGAQFLLVLPHTSYDDANRMAQGMLALGASLTHQIDSGLVSINTHIGVASTENSGRLVSPLLNEADYSLYQNRKGNPSP